MWQTDLCPTFRGAAELGAAIIGSSECDVRRANVLFRWDGIYGNSMEHKTWKNTCFFWCFVRLLHVSDDRDEQRVSSLTRGHSAVRRANNAGDKCQRIWCYCGPAWIYWFLLFLFLFAKAVTQVLCPPQAINISQSQQRPSIFHTVSHLFLLCDQPLHLSGFVFVPLV